jgi:coenzyme F420 hydrogenase subunit beta
MPELEAIGVSSARAVGVERSGATSAVIRSLLVAAYSAGLIDGAVVVDVDLWSLEPVARIVTNVEEIVSVVGPHYLWAPVLSALNEAIFERGLRQLAVVGSPCVAQGARRLVSAKNQRLWPYREAIRVTIAQFCTGVYAPDVVSDLVERRHGIARHLIQDLTVSATDGALCVTLWDGSVRNVPLTEVEAFARAGCGSCDDYLGEWADVAVGSVGALAEHATLITRTPAGELLCQNARRFGLLETNPRVDRAALDAAKAEKDRRARAQAYDKLRILMLDALSDPQKRAQVRKQFVSLYGSARAEVAKKEECYGSCSGC